MVKYSVTLNIRIPAYITDLCRSYVISDSLSYDWRESTNTHVTLKAIYKSDEAPTPRQIAQWSTASKNALTHRTPFMLRVSGVAQFSNVVYAKVYSEYLHTLHEQLYVELPSSQPEYEGKAYNPHISLGVLEQKGICKDLALIDFGTFIVSEIELVVWTWSNRKMIDCKVLEAYRLVD